ncbi:MAG: hypothetical protein JSW28_03060 [Thermoplasmata archaeon]|nr:MAG: hypothetical protein JSW28_03060 [Thermoplasmata archaeon]
MMRLKAFLLILLLIIVAMVFLPSSSAQEDIDYNIEQLDPEGDVIEFSDSGYSEVDTHDSLDMVAMRSIWDENTPAPQDDEITVEAEFKSGTPGESDLFYFQVWSTGDNDYIIIKLPTQNEPVCVDLANEESFTCTETISGNKISLRTLLSNINPPNTRLEFYAFFWEDGEPNGYFEIGPDNLIFIETPSNFATVSGSVSITGEKRYSSDNVPDGDVIINIDSGEDINLGSGGTFSHTWNSADVSDGEHTITVETTDSGTGETYTDSIKVYVDQDTANYPSFGNQPDVIIGDTFDYINEFALLTTSFPGDDTTTMVLEAIETINAGGSSYETYRYHSHQKSTFEIASLESNTITDTDSWRIKSDFGLIKEQEDSHSETTLQATTDTNTTRTYSPPKKLYKTLPVKVTDKWDLTTTVKEETTTKTEGAGTEKETTTQQESNDFECLYKTEMNVGGELLDIFVIKESTEGLPFSDVHYYSPELGVDVKLESYDGSRKMLWYDEMVDLTRGSGIFISVQDIRVEPDPPKANEKATIKIDLMNQGNAQATNVKLKVKANNAVIKEETVASIDGGEEKTVEISWTPDDEGEYTISAEPSHGGTSFSASSLSISVGPASEDSDSALGNPMMIIVLLIVIIVVVLVAVIAVRKRKAGAEPSVPPAEAGEGAAVAPAAGVAAQPQAPQAYQAASQATATAAGVMTETIRCPGCQKPFAVSYTSKPIKVKCPSCGVEGVLN